LNDAPELERIGAAFNRQFHHFLSRFRTIRNQALLLSLYNSFCTSFYGIENVGLEVSSRSIRFLRKSVNLALMKLLRLPRESVSPYLIAYGVLNADAVWTSRALTFWRDLARSTKPHSRLLLSWNSETVAGHCSVLRILPAALPALTRTELHDKIVHYWICRKELL
jgi:hypothetical protein